MITTMSLQWCGLSGLIHLGPGSQVCVLIVIMSNLGPTKHEDVTRSCCYI